MKNVYDLMSNSCLWCTLLAWFLAQALKIPTHALTERKWDLKYFLSPGGMPSSHTAGVVALTIMVGAIEGCGSAFFAICVTFGAIVMYDAAGVRRETGRQGAAINEILRKVMIDGNPISDDELKEIVGHSPFEVAMGALTGVIVAAGWLLLVGTH